MRRIIFLLALFVCITGLLIYGQNRNGNSYPQSKSTYELYVAFYSDDFLNQKEATKTAMNIKGFRKLANEYSIELQKGINLSDEKLDELAANAISQGNASTYVYKLKKIYKVKIMPGNDKLLLELVSKLEVLKEIEYVCLVSLNTIPQPQHYTSVTPNYEDQQSYLGADPGVDMLYAWSLGLTGQGIRIRDIEYGFNPKHEDLRNTNVGLGGGLELSANVPASSLHHGMAVFGIVYAGKSDYGITGMAYGASEMLLFPLFPSCGGFDPVGTVVKTIEQSSKGDVIIYEMQMPAKPEIPSSFVPLDFINIYWDITKAATDGGIIVISAGGNGAQNLDEPFFKEYNERGNSGAIIVGAGTPDTDHAPLYFTTYGSRVDVQAWGKNVLSLGYGNFAVTGDSLNQCYSLFSGTSAATPIVASCVVTLQSYYHMLTGDYMTADAMRELLIETGTPQKTDLQKHIGPIPNMRNAIERIQQKHGQQASDNNHHGNPNRLIFA